MGALEDLLSGATDKREGTSTSTTGSSLRSLLTPRTEEPAIAQEPEEDILNIQEGELRKKERKDEFDRSLRFAKRQFERDKAGFKGVLTDALGQGQFMDLGIESLDDLKNSKITQTVEGAELAYDIADNNIEIGRIGTKMKRGTATREDLDRLSELQKENASVQDKVKDKPFMARATGQLAPFLLNSLVQGGKGYMVGAVVGGTGAAIAGQLGPQAAFPEEAFTVPALANAFGKLGATLSATKDIGDIEGGLSFIQLQEMGMDQEKASVVSDIVGGGSMALEVAQFKLLKRLLPGQDKLINSSIAKAIKKVLGDTGAGRATARITGTAVPEAGIETLQEFWANVAETAGTMIQSELDEKDLSPQNAAELKQRLTEGLTETFATTVAAFPVFTIPGASYDYVSTTTQANLASKNGTTLKGEPVTEAVPAQVAAPGKRPVVVPTSAKPSVREIMGVEEETDGTEVSGSTDMTDTQAANQLTGNDAINDILTEMSVDQGLKQSQGLIAAGEQRIENLNKFLDDAIMEEDHEGALQVANTIQAETEAVADQYVRFIENAQQAAELNDSLLAPEQITEVQARVTGLLDQAQDNVQKQTQAVQNLRARQNQEYIDLLGTDRGLEQELIDASVESQRATGQILKTNNKVVSEMRQRQTLGDRKYFEKLNPKSIIDLRTEIGNQALVNRREGEEAQVLARDNAMLNWADRLLEDMSAFDVEQARLEEAQSRTRGVAEPAQVRQPEAVEPQAPVEPVEIPVPEAAQRFRATETKRLLEGRRKEERRVAERAKVIKGKRTPAQLREALKARPKKKPVAPKPKPRKVPRVPGQRIKDEAFQSDIDSKTRSKARKLFDAAAIRFKGKTLTGPSHMSIIQKNPALEQALIDTPVEQIDKVMPRGFVQKDGTFTNREQAAKMVGRKNLISEDFLDEISTKATAKAMGTKVTDEAAATARKAKVKQALNETTGRMSLAKRLIKRTGATIALVDDTSKVPGLTDQQRQQMDASRAIYSPSRNTIYLNTKTLGRKDPRQIQNTFLHETLHSVMKKTLRDVNQNAYRKGMRRISDWWNESEQAIKQAMTKDSHPRVKTFVSVMNNASTGTNQAQADLEAGTDSVNNLDENIKKFEEALTYPFTSPEVAKFLNSVPAPPSAKTSKIKTMWDWLLNEMFTAFGIPTRTGTTLARLNEIANDILDLEEGRQVTKAEARFARDLEATFDFGANVDQAMVQKWADEIDATAANAAPSQVVANAEEAEEVLGYKPDDNVKSFWHPDGKVVFIANRLESQDEFVSKWMHENVAHQGLRNVFGEGALFKRFLDQAFTLFSLKDADVLNEIIELYDLGKDKGFGRQLTKTEKREAAEEVIARRAEQLKPVTKRGLLTRFKNFLKQWLPANFLLKKKDRKIPLTDKDIASVLDMARENILTGESRFNDMLVKALDRRAPTVQFKGWETLPNFMETDETYKKWAKEVDKKAPRARKWYSQHQETLKETFGQDADLMNILLAVTSPQADVETNVQFAVDTYAYMMGLREKPGALFPNQLKKRIDMNWTSPDAMMRDLESKNFKVTEFLRALQGDPNATVGDLWMYRTFFGDPAVYDKEAETYSIPQITGLRQKLHDLASQLSEETGDTWTPREVQAALWVFVNAAQSGKDITTIADYQSGFNKPSDKYGGKTPLEWLRTIVPNLEEGPLSDQIGLQNVPMAKQSTLQKKLLLQLSREPGVKTSPVKTLAQAKKFVAAQKANKYSPVLSILDPKELLKDIKAGRRRVFMTNDGQAGYAVADDGDIQMVFSNSDKRGVGTNLIAEAIEKGGRKLDAFEGYLTGWYKNTFGFEEVGRDTWDDQYMPEGWNKKSMGTPDVVYMELSDNAQALFRNKKQQIKANLVRDNLGGFTGNFSRQVRFARDAQQPLEDTVNMDQENIDREFLETGNDGQSVVGQIHEMRDQSALNVNRLANTLEQEFLEKFGGRKALKAAPGIRQVFGSGRLLNTADTELLQKAMNLYIDSGRGANRAKAEAFAAKLSKKDKEGKLTAGELEKLEIVTRMLNMSQEEIAWAQNNIEKYYQDFFDFAKDNGLLNSQVDNYVKRIWQMPKEFEDANITWSGAGTTGFKLQPSSGKQRVLDSIIDGWELGMDLRTDGVIQNLQAYANELGYVNANRRFMDYMKSLINESNLGVAMELEPGQRGPAGFAEILDRGFAEPGKVAWARQDIADAINKIGQRPSHRIWDVPLIKGLRKINAVLKSTLLSVSMFHHLAGLRSYMFGVKGLGWSRLRPFKAYKEGLRKIDERPGFENPNYQHMGPIIDLLVREGLTLGQTQDWDGEIMMDSVVEDYLKTRTTKGAKAALKGWQGAVRWKRQWVNGLFGQLFAGLKAQSAAAELTHSIRKMEKKKGRGLTDAEIKSEALKIARLINADFGGLNLPRMGRNPDIQKMLQFFLLAPDWTESNWRTVTGMIPGANKALGKLIGDNPAPKGMPAVYQKFWGGIALRGALSVLAAQQAVLLLFGNDEDRKEYYKQLENAIVSREEFSKGRWATVDLTPAFRKINAEPGEGKRVAFNLLGHFKDILKIMTPVQLAKHKVSPAVRTAESFATRTDWKGDRFKSVGELWEGIKDLDPALTVADGEGPRDPEGWFGAMSQLLAAGMYNLRSNLPIPLAEMLTGAGSESSMVSSVGRAAGLDIRDVRFRDPNEQAYWERRQEVKLLEQALEDAKTVKDTRMIFNARRDIKNYENFNKVKARLGVADRLLKPVRKKIRELELKQRKKGLTESEKDKLRRLRERKARIYENFADVVER